MGPAETSRIDLKKLKIAVFVAASLLFVWGIWSVPILNHNEARRMVVVQEMLRSGNWLVPTMNGEIYLAKPPLLYWLMALSCKIFQSQSEWAMRLPTSLAAVFVVAFFLNRASRYLGEVPAIFGAAILASSGTFIEFARTAQIEMLLALTCTLTGFLFLDYLKSGKKSFLFLAYAFLGFGIMTKGPFAVLYFLPPVALFWLTNRDRAVLRGLMSIPGWLIALLVALPWSLYVFLEYRPFLSQVVEQDIAGKVSGERDVSPVYTYPLFLIGTFLPWILVTLHKTKAQIRKAMASSDQRYVLIFSIVPVVLLSLMADKHGKYLLPMFPFMAMILGDWCHDAYARVREGSNRRWVGPATVGGIGLLLAGHFIFQVVVTPRMFSYRFSALRPIAEAIHERAEGRPVYLHNDLIIQLVYYVGAPMPVKDTKEVVQLIESRQTFLLLSSSKIRKKLSGMPLCVIEEFSPFLKEDRSAVLLGSGDFCAEGSPRLSDKPDGRD